MKKLFLIFWASAGFITGSCGQGLVNWSGVGSFFIAQTNSSMYSTIPFGGGLANGNGSVGNTFGNTAADNAGLGYAGYCYALLVSTTAVAPPSSIVGLASWSETGLTATNGSVSNGRIIQMADDGVSQNTQATANNWPSGTTANVILVGWSANLGITYAAVLAKFENWATQGISGGYFGVSSMGSLVSQSGNPGVVIFGGGPGQIDNQAANPMQMYLITAPEPDTMALAILGGVSLLMFRRKK